MHSKKITITLLALLIWAGCSQNTPDFPPPPADIISRPSPTIKTITMAPTPDAAFTPVPTLKASPTPTCTPTATKAPTPSPTPTIRPESVVSISLEGEPVMEITRCSAWDDPGVTASDTVDGDISAFITIDTDLDVNEAGRYTIKYTAVNTIGETAETERTVYVRYNREDYEAFEKNGKVVYLTFDDGPSENTEKLLGILDKYNVKATFFVKNSLQLDLIKQEAAKGHTVAVHTYSHSYSGVYKSEQAYFDDLYKMQDEVYNRIGLRPMLIRFPGGSSNTVSRSYNTGIMTRLAQQVREKGFQYFDWNVSTTDGNINTNKPETVRDHAIAGMKSKNIAVILMHDTHSYTVDAVEDIIKFGIENGYTFLPLSEFSYAPHHSISN